jgi:hypothetical protein
MNVDPTTSCAICNQPVGDQWVVQMVRNVPQRVACEGCDLTERYDAYRNTARITSRLWLEATMLQFNLKLDEEKPNVSRRTDKLFGLDERARLADRLCASMERVKRYMKIFETRAWFPVLQPAVVASKCHGMSARFPVLTPCGQARLLAYASAGRAMITIDAKHSSITLITEEKAPPPGRMGVQGVDGNELQLVELLVAATGACERGSVTLIDDTDVGIL